MPDFEVVRGGHGRGLVRDGRRVFSVPDALAQALAQAGADGHRQWRDLVGETGVRRPFSPIWLRLVLVPAGAANRAASCLAPLAGTAGLAGLAAAGAIGLASSVAIPVLGGPGSAAAVAVGAGLFVLTAVWHELGHAAALRREGLRAGRIGAGLLWVLPVLTCDVTGAALLPRGGRLRVDAAGVVFQFAAAGALAAAANLWPPAGHGAAGALAAVIWSLVPLLRTDGHWLLLDLVGLPDLDAAPPPAWPRRLLAVLVVWRVTTAVSLLGLLALVPWRIDLWLARTGGAALPAAVVVALRSLAWMAAAIGGWRALRRLRTLLRTVVRDLALTRPGG